MLIEEVLGDDALSVDDSSCGMPVSAQIERLQRELADRFGEGPTVVSADLYDLEPAERDATIDAVVAGELSPFVLVAGRLVCTGSVDVEAVVDSLDSATAVRS